jgi:hypothetical protein
MLSILSLLLLSMAIHNPDGEESRFWNHAAVVYAQITRVESVDPIRNTIYFRPIATLTGDFDAAFQGERSASAAIGSAELTLIAKAPKKDAKVILLLDIIESRRLVIRNGAAPFLPKDDQGNRPCLIDVTGFDDPKVTETIENLRKLRGKQREEAEQKAAAAKKATEKNGK